MRLFSTTFVLIMIFLSACAKRDYGDLINGYKVIAVNPAEIYIAKPDDELIFGPSKEIGISGDFIFVYCGSEKIIRNGFVSTPGYNIVNTKNGLIYREISNADLDALLVRISIKKPLMKSASSYLTSDFSKTIR